MSERVIDPSVLLREVPKSNVRNNDLPLSAPTSSSRSLLLGSGGGLGWWIFFRFSRTIGGNELGGYATGDERSGMAFWGGVDGLGIAVEMVFTVWLFYRSYYFSVGPTWRVNDFLSTFISDIQLVPLCLSAIEAGSFDN